MKRSTIGMLIALQLAIALPAAATIDRYDDNEAHPLRVAAYLIHPVGFIAEWLVFRPFHYVVAAAAPVFGHEQHGRKHQE
jgi:hypothetical protein